MCQRAAMFRSLLLAPLLLLFGATSARAQQQDAQLWEQFNVVVPVAPDLRVTVEQIARISDRQGGLYTTEFGGLLGWQVAKGVELGFGYRHVGFYNGNTAPDEERLRQQVVLTSGRFAGRLRSLERQWYEADINSVPAVIINEKYLISGGHPADAFERALRTIAAEA